MFVPISSNSSTSSLDRRIEVGDDGQRVVFDLDQLGGVDARGARLAQHDGDDVADEAHLFGSQERPRGLGDRARGTAAPG